MKRAREKQRDKKTESERQRYTEITESIFGQYVNQSYCHHMLHDQKECGHPNTTLIFAF